MDVCEASHAAGAPVSGVGWPTLLWGLWPMSAMNAKTPAARCQYRSTAAVALLRDPVATAARTRRKVLLLTLPGSAFRSAACTAPVARRRPVLGRMPLCPRPSINLLPRRTRRLRSPLPQSHVRRLVPALRHRVYCRAHACEPAAAAARPVSAAPATSHTADGEHRKRRGGAAQEAGGVGAQGARAGSSPQGC